MPLGPARRDERLTRHQEPAQGIQGRKIHPRARKSQCCGSWSWEGIPGMDQEPRVELLVWLSRIVSPHPSELGVLFYGTELWGKGIWAGNFSIWGHDKTQGHGGGAGGAGRVPVTPWGAGGDPQEPGDFAGRVCARNEPFAAPSQNTPQWKPGLPGLSPAAE